MSVVYSAQINFYNLTNIMVAILVLSAVFQYAVDLLYGLIFGLCIYSSSTNQMHVHIKRKADCLGPDITNNYVF